MSDNYGKFSENYIEKVKKFFLENDFSFKELSNNSSNLFGQYISEDQIKWYSRNDQEGSWSILKANRGKKTEDTPIQEKLQTVANKLYNLIVDDDSELSANQLAQLAKTWSDLVDKAKLTQNDTVSKIPAQAAKDLFEKAILEHEENTN